MAGWGKGWGNNTSTSNEYEYVEPKGNSWSGWKKPKNKLDPMQKVDSELAKKRAVLDHYNIQDPTKQEDDRNFVEKILNTPQDTGFLGDTLDILSRGQYASANLAKHLVEGDSIGGALKAAGKGVIGSERSDYDEVLDSAGMEKGFGRSALGFVGDILLDPTTYLTLGTGAVAKTGGKAVGKAVGKELLKEGAEKAVVKAVDKGGLKFAGKTLIPQVAFEKAAEKVGIPKVANAVRDSKAGQLFGKAFAPNFREVGTDKALWDEYVGLKKEYENALNYGQHKAIDDAVDFGKNFTKEERELISKGIQDPILLKGQPQEIIDAARNAKKLFESMARKEQDLGLLNKVQKDYLPGIYPDKGKSLLDGIIYNPSLKASLGKHNKAKTFETLQDAIDAGLKPETDISKLLGIRNVASKRATTTQTFIDDVLNQFGEKVSHKNIDKLGDNVSVFLPKGNLKFFPQDTIPSDLLKGLSDDELIEIPANIVKKTMGVSKNVPVYALPRQVAKDLNNFKKGVWDEGTNGFVKNFIDKPTNLWKLYATATNPGFHIRNAASNMFQTYLNNGSALLNPINHTKALGTLLHDKPVFDKLLKNTKINVAGKELTLKEARELMEKEGVLNKGWFDKDLNNVLEERLNGGLKPKLKDANLINPLSQKNALGKAGRYVGSGVENQARAFNFLSEVARNGGDVKDAAKTVDKYLFDYGDLTDFEKNIMRRGLPFYTWLRKNMPLQAEQLAKQPGKYAAIPKAINAVENTTENVDEKYLPDYMENWVRTPFKQGDNPVYLNPNMPYGDLDRFNPLNVEKNILGSLTPLAKVPLELTTNRNFFFNSPIEKYQGQLKKAPSYLPQLPNALQKALGVTSVENDQGQMEQRIPAKTRYLMAQIPFMENVSKAGEYEGDKWFNQMLSWIAGAKIAPYEVEKQMKNYSYEERQQLRDLFDKLVDEGIIPKDYNDKFKKKEEKSGW